MQKNSAKEKAIILPAPIVDNEDLFLSELLAGHRRWKGKAAEAKLQGKDDTREKEYAEAYRVLLNEFSAGQKTRDDER